VEGKDWIDFPGALYGDAKTRFLFSGTYTIHAMREEACGISITEYMKADLIPIVPDEGGACEVADNPGLSFHTDDEAAAILTRLLNDPEFRELQRRKCADRAAVFSYGAYLARQHALLKSILES
jgi:glycosyltransferase involved in cell wall biosynthesis